MVPAVRRSAGIWYLMKSSVRSWVSLISLESDSGGRFKTLSRRGLIWTTHTANNVLSSCIARQALAKRCCSGDIESIASLNSLAVGMVVRLSGIRKSSLFCTIIPYLGSKVSAETTRPMSTMKLLSWRACAVSCTSDGVCPLNAVMSHACTKRSPLKRTAVAALMLNFIGFDPRPPRTWVKTGSKRPPSILPPLFSSIATMPSGLCSSERRTAYEKATGWASSRKSLRL
mmetsp:Transcript_16025/g.38015  ORF Transcript_16025/g.38015 Transcript_16025/m.38015 type:complete len:229 (+) Transcript_16025:1468-2154(+)